MAVYDGALGDLTLSGVEAQRHTLFQVAQWTPRPINRDDRIRRGAWRSDFVWSRGTAAYSISGGAVDTQTHELEARGGQVEAGYINSTTEQKATMNDRGKNVDEFYTVQGQRRTGIC